MNKLAIFCLIVIGLLSACRKDENVESAHHGHEHKSDGHAHEAGAESEAPENISLTLWGKKSELFLEYPPLAAGQEAEFAAHVTEFKGFKPVSKGRVEIILASAEGKQMFTSSEPARPGIFKLIVKLLKPGVYSARLRIASGNWKEPHDLGTLNVRDSSTPPGEHHEEEAHPQSIIPFLKEQQWQTDFATAWVAERPLAKTIAVPGAIRASTRDALVLKASAAGTIQGSLPSLGASVEPGQTLAQLQTSEGIKAIEVPAPSLVAVVHISAGDRVENGQKLFSLLDLSKLWVEARVYEADIGQVSQSKKALVEIPGLGLREASLVHTGGTLDAQTRTVPYTFEMSNPQGKVRVGQSCQVHILTGEYSSGIAIPSSAIVDDGGQSTVYVQLEGETFDRRVLKLGIRQGEWVQVLEGLKKGERLVTRGGYSVRMAASSGAIPAHIH